MTQAPTEMTERRAGRYGREFDFALIVDGVEELTEAVANALFEAGCDDATPSMQHGLLYVEFSREAATLDQAILSGIGDVRRAGIGGEVLRVDECDLVTKADIARRANVSRQRVGQYIAGQRGPGGFPPPECHLTDDKPLWSWCEVSHWLASNHLLSPETHNEAEAVAAINNRLEMGRHRRRRPDLAASLDRKLASA